MSMCDFCNFLISVTLEFDFQLLRYIEPWYCPESLLLFYNHLTQRMLSLLPKLAEGHLQTSCMNRHAVLTANGMLTVLRYCLNCIYDCSCSRSKSPLLDPPSSACDSCFEYIVSDSRSLEYMETQLPRANLTSAESVHCRMRMKPTDS